MGNMSKEEKVSNFLKSKNILIVLSSSSERIALKKICIDMGAQLKNISVSDTFVQAFTQFEKEKYHILLTQREIKGGTCLDLFNLHKRRVPDRSEAMFGILLDQESAEFTSFAQEDDIDFLMTRPYTAKGFKNNIEKNIIKKLNMDNIAKAYYKTLDVIENQDLEAAHAMVQDFTSLGATPVLEFYLNGRFLRKKELFDDAILEFQNVLKLEPKHFKSLIQLFDLYHLTKNHTELAITGKRILEDFPMHPKRIEGYLAALVATGDHENMTEFINSVIGNDQISREVKSTLAAGLAISAKYYVSIDELKLAKEACEQVITFGRYNEKALLTSLNCLIDIKHEEVVHDLFKRIDLANISVGLMVIEYRMSHLNEEHQTVFVQGLDMIKKGIHDFHVYDILLKSALGSGRKLAMIEDIIQKAIANHSDRADHFKTYLPN